MHRLLENQLLQQFGALDSVPDEWSSFLEVVNYIFEKFEQDQLTQGAMADQSLSESERHLKNLLENPIDVISILDEDIIFRYQSPSVERLLGYRPEELVNVSILEFIHPDDMGKTVETLTSLLNNPDTTRKTEFRFRHKGGTWHYLELTGTTLPIGPRASQIFTTMQDVSEREELRTKLKSTDERRSHLVNISGEIAHEIAAATNMAELYQKVVVLIKEKFDLYYTQLLRYNPGLDTLVLVAGYGQAGERMLEDGYQVPMGDGFIGRVAAGGDSIIINDVNQSKGWSSNPLLPYTQSEIATPIKLGDQLLGVLDAQNDLTDSVDSDMQLVLEMLCGQIAVAIESIRLRTEMEERLRELDALQRITTQEGWQAFQEIEEKGKYGYRFDYSQGRPVTIHPGDPDNGHLQPVESETNLNEAELALRKEMAIRGEIIGSLGIELDPDNPLDDEDQELLESISLQVAEALERARLFEQSQRSAAELAVLNEMGNAFTEALDEDTIIENIYIYTSQLMDTSTFFVANYAAEKGEISFPLVIETGERITEGHPNWKDWTPRPLGTGITGHIIQSRTPILIQENVEENLSTLGVDYKQHSRGAQSWVGVPMTLGDRVLGVIAAQSETTPRLYKPHHLELLTAVASQAAITIDNARRFQEEQAQAEQERLVRTITDRVRRGADQQTILRIMLEELEKMLGAKKSIVRLGTREQLLSAATSRNPDRRTLE